MTTSRRLALLLAPALAATFFALLSPLLPAKPAAREAPRAKAKQAVEADAEKDDGKLEFLRFVDDGKGGGKLEAAVATYRNDDGVAVHLVAAVHVGEKAYYEGLSKTFEGYDALLYELVKPKGADAPKPGEPRALGMLGMFQQFLKNTLELEFQLDAIDYSKPNFVHADLDAETFLKMQEERGESILGLMLRSMMSEMKRQQELQKQGKKAPQVGLMDLLAAMGSPDSARQYKLLLGRQFQDIEAQMAGLEGPNGSVILTERNKAALKVLERTIGEGKKEIGIFYGAGHMRGLEDALLDDMGFERVGVEWRVAWDMTKKAEAKAKPKARVKARPPVAREEEPVPIEQE